MPATDIDEQTFERSMAEMSLAALKSKAPALVDYVMGFQLVEKNEDDTRAFGFFAFKIGKQWVYGPVFFLTGEVKGLEMMYVKEQDLFLPMEEGWVNYLIKRKPHVLGAPQDQSNSDRLGISQPDLRLLVRPPQATKLGAARDQWLVDEIERSIGYGTKVAESLQPVAEALSTVKVSALPERMQLPHVLAANGWTDDFLQQCKQEPKLAQAVLQYYSVDDFLQAEEKVAATAPIPATDSEPPKPVLIMDRDDAASDLGRAKWLTEEEKKQIMRGNVVMRDSRPEEETRKVYRFESTYGLENPQEGGLYDMLTTDGGMAKVMILKPRVIGHGGAANVRLVVDPVKNVFRFDPSTDLYTGHKYMRDEFETYLSEHGQEITDDAFTLSADLSDKDRWDTTHIVVGPNGEAIIPFRVQQKFQSVDGNTTLMVEPTFVEYASNDQVGHERREERSFLPFEGVLHDEHGLLDIAYNGEQNYRSQPGNSYRLNDRYRIILTDKPLRRPVAKGSTLLLPRNAGFKVFRVRQSESAEIDPGTTADLFLNIEKTAEQVKLYSDGLHLHVTSDSGTVRARSEKQAYDLLCNKLGVGAEEARKIYKEAKAQQTSRTARYWVSRLTQKQAAEKQAGPFDVAMVNRSYRQDPWIDANIEESFGDITSQPAEYASPTDPRVYEHNKGENNYHQVYQRDIQMINEAAQSGQKDVFDASALGALINVNDINQSLDEYSADLVKALDKLGRTLFLMYWHQEEVQDRYGKQQVTDLEDNVRSTFQSLGDVILDLKQKSPVDSDAFGRGILNVGAN